MKTATFLFSLFLFALVTAEQAQTATIIAKGSTWKYLDNGTDQSTTWRGVGFSDSAWASGASPLGYSNSVGFYGTFPLGTTVSYGSDGLKKYITTFFRKTFSVTNPNDFLAYTLNVLRDDGIVIYVNGTEAARLGMAPGPVFYNTLANVTINTATAYDTVGLSPSLFVAGTNTLAVEVHQAAITSSDIVLDLELIGSLPTVTRGPYLQMNNSSSMTVRWRTDAATDSVVLTGTTQGSLPSSTTVSTIGTEHEVRVTGLQPDTKYFYAVGSTSGTLAGNAADFYFKTAPAAGTDRAVRLWVLGDAGTANASQQAVRDGYYGSPNYSFNDMVLLLGDNAYNTGLDSEYQSALFNMYPTVLRQSPVWSCLGNHETAQATSGAYTGVAYFDLFSFPTAAECGGYASGSERYFSWDFGNIHFISLDAQTTDPTLRTNMLAWLDNDLASNTRRWTVAIWHHPPYTKGSHNSDTESQLTWTRENLVPRLEGAGVDIVLSGHSHCYERSKFIDGFTAKPTLLTSGTFIDSGNGRADGNGIYGKDYGGHRGAVYTVAGSSGQISGGSLNHPVMLTSLNELGSMIIDISNNRLDAKFITSTGAVHDYLTIEKGPLVTVSTPIATAAEYGPANGQFAVTRSGSTASPLAVQATIGGTASTTRYAVITVPVTIPTGKSSQTVEVTPQPDSLAQGAQTVTLTSTSNVAYRLGSVTSGLVTITDTPAGAPPVALWRLDKFGADANNTAIAGDLADPDHDGTLNLLEYALGLEPLIPSTSGLPVLDASGIYLTLTTQKNPAATDVTYNVEAKDDLINGTVWSSATTTILQNTSTVLQVRDNTPITNAPHRFMRLQITRP